MADKVLMNKNSLASLKTELKEYKTALPVFEMKEQQLSDEVQNIEFAIERLKEAIEATNKEVKKWSAVMVDRTFTLDELVNVASVETTHRELAGVVIENLSHIDFEEQEVDLLQTPLWLDKAIEAIKDQMTDYTMLQIEEGNLKRLRDELAEARRMKNALKEVFIPETKTNIRKIQIYLGDIERLEIGCSKLVKKKKMQKAL